MNPTVMIADDEALIHDAVKGALKDSSYQFTDVYTGQGVLDSVRSEPPDAILLDVRMPGKSGLQVLEELRRNPKTAGVRIILISGDPSLLGAQGGRAPAVDGRIAKPFDPLRLKKILDELLRRGAPGPEPPGSRRDTAASGRGAGSDLANKLTAAERELRELELRHVAESQRLRRAINTLHERLLRVEKSPVVAPVKRAVPPAPAPSAPRSRVRPAFGPWLSPALIIAGAVLAVLFLVSLTGDAPPPEPAPAAVDWPEPPAQSMPEAAQGPVTAAPVAAVPSGPALESIRVQSFRVTMLTSEPVDSLVRLSSDNRSLLVNLPGTESRLPGRRLDGKGLMIRRVTAFPMRFRGGPGTRVKIDLRRPVAYKVTSSGNRTVVDLFYGGRKPG